ncbi:hypothetical protein GRJ22_12315 [Photobacterium carnosum]|uniref:hypothetical protein n=1 Tax=Photobacterium carnosum TaxID=2023717 RepID=UPI001E5954DF|nr:hypothetical protein [Photobacterium carnosum]MCD9557216.1 hypothetical protein [Photobacterium carnosum]
MGWFSSVCSFVSNVVSSTVSTVKSAVSNAWEGAKSVARSAVSWMAKKAESVVASVKTVWQTVKPYIPIVRNILKKVAASVYWPWLKSGLLFLEKGLHFIETFGDTALGKKISKEIQKIINLSKNIYNTFFSDQELKEAKERDEMLKEAQVAATAAGNSEAEKTIAISKLLNAYGIINTEVNNLLSEKSQLLSFDHYLRLRATQKLLLDIEETLRFSQDIENITEDDIFLLEVAKDLIAEHPTLSTENATRLDAIIYKRKQKNLLPFVFEEMIAAWNKTVEELDAEWRTKSKTLSKVKIELRRLQNEKAITELSRENQARLNELHAFVPQEQDRVNMMAKRKRERTSYVYAAEGLMQTIEKTAEELESENLDFLIEDSAEIGQLIINCLQHGKRWEELTQDEQDLIMDYANIFEEACKARTESLLKVTV